MKKQTIDIGNVDEVNDNILRVRSGVRAGLLCHLLPLLAIAAVPAGAAFLQQLGTSDEKTEVANVSALQEK